MMDLLQLPDVEPLALWLWRVSNGIRSHKGLIGGIDGNSPVIEFPMEVALSENVGRHRLRSDERFVARGFGSFEDGVKELSRELGEPNTRLGGLMVNVCEPIVLPHGHPDGRLERVDVVALSLPCYSSTAIVRGFYGREQVPYIYRMSWLCAKMFEHHFEYAKSVVASAIASKHTWQWAQATGENNMETLYGMFIAKLDWYNKHPSQMFRR